jgi:hypothetical protein
MERERFSQHDRSQTSGGGPTGDDGLDQLRGEVDELLRASDNLFDSINNLHAQQYLEQNIQTGGQ